jgi:hypothetical protein
MRNPAYLPGFLDFDFFAFFPIFISSSGFGFIRTRMPARRLVSPSSSLDFIMPQTPNQKAKAKERRLLNRSFQLIGEFMFNWNIVEADLGKYIASLCELEKLESSIVCANLNFQAKMGIVYATVHLYAGIEKEHQKIFNRLFEINTEWRNVIAHCMHSPKDGEIDFIRIQAKRELKIPDTAKTHKEFAAIFKELRKLSREIGKLAKNACEMRVKYRNRTDNKSGPSLHTGAIGISSLPQSRPLGLLHFLTPNPEKLAQTPLPLQVPIFVKRPESG